MTMLLRYALRRSAATRRAFGSARNEAVRRDADLNRQRLVEMDARRRGRAVESDVSADAAIFSELDSTAAAIFLKNNPSTFESIERRHQEMLRMRAFEQSQQSNSFANDNDNDKTKSSASIRRPLSAEESLRVLSVGEDGDFNRVSVSLPTNFKIETATHRVVASDHGFFVHEDKLRDEYAAGSADQLPASEMNEEPFEIHAFEENVSVEKIDFQRPGQSAFLSKGKKRLAHKAMAELASEDENCEMISDYGLEGDARLAPLTGAHCYGCGATFHSNQSSLPGFVPVEMYREIASNQNLPLNRQRTDYLCRRCFLYKEYKFLLNVNVCEVDYFKTMGHLKLVQEALILLVLDMADLEGSIHRALPEIIGSGKSMIVVGNKVDLLPPDVDHGYLKHYYEALRAATRHAGFADQFNILKYSLVSAKTGFGVEDLISNIYAKWISPRGTIRSNIYVVGCTNAGKSTLFNAFLQSDLCKVKAVDLVERVTTSPWPGTTLSLLKFPIWNPTASKLEERRRRLLDFQKWSAKEALLSTDIFKSTGDPKYVTLQGRIGNTFKEKMQEMEGVGARQTAGIFYGDLKPETEEERKRRCIGNINLNSATFLEGNWCYDTPGTINRQQILDLFTLEELINVIPRTMIIPRTFIVYPGESLLIGGVARIDIDRARRYNDNDADIFLTIFASDLLPVHHMPTCDVDAFMAKYAGTAVLRAPLGDALRLERFPALRYKTLTLKNDAANRHEDSFGDVVLSSVGWVSLTSLGAETVRLRAWTPEARGIFTRAPILRKPAMLRGRRIPGTNEYKAVLPAISERSIIIRGTQLNKPIEMISVPSPTKNDDDNVDDERDAANKILFDKHLPKKRC